MEYNIYDLMDEFADEEIKLSPYNAADLRRIEELTMKKIEEQQGRRPAAKKAGRIARALLVAAVVTALCTATVVAAKLGVADSFKGYFGDLTAEQKQVMEALGTTDLQPVTSNGTTITPLAAICDENNYYLRLRIEAPEGTELYTYQEGEGNMQPWNYAEGHDFITSEGYDIPGVSCNFDWFDETPGDNVVEVVVKLRSSYLTTRDVAELKETEGEDFTVLSFTDGKSSSCGSITSGGSRGTRISPMRCCWRATGALRSAGTPSRLPRSMWTRPDEPPKANGRSPGYPLTLEYFRISPLAVVGEYSYPYDETIAEGTNVGYGVKNFALVMKDGSAVEIGADGSAVQGPDYTSIDYCFDAPIDVTQVDHIVFGDQIIPVPQTGE